jgi:SAM-dependent methyltransferase
MSEPAIPPGWPMDQLEQVRSCPICDEPERVLLHAGLEDRTFRVAPGKWQLWRCVACRCAYLDPRPTRGSIAAAYRRYFPRQPQEQAARPRRVARLRDSLWKGYLNARYGYALQPASRLGAALLWLFPKRRWSAALMVRWLSKPAGRPRLLDVGFGDASFLRFMAEAGWWIEGLEVDQAAVDAARSAGFEVQVGGIEDPPYEAGSFDAITLSHVIEHLHDPVGSLQACYRLLRPSGVLWLATPNLESPAHRRFGRDWFGLDPPRHLVLFGLRALDQALTKAGFVEITHPRAYRGELVLAGSEALASGRDVPAARTPLSPKLRRLARVLDLAAAVHPRFGEELVAFARKPSTALAAGGKPAGARAPHQGRHG